MDRLNWLIDTTATLTDKLAKNREVLGEYLSQKEIILHQRRLLVNGKKEYISLMTKRLDLTDMGKVVPAKVVDGMILACRQIIQANYNLGKTTHCLLKVERDRYRHTADQPTSRERE